MRISEVVTSWCIKNEKLDRILLDVWAELSICVGVLQTEDSNHLNGKIMFLVKPFSVSRHNDWPNHTKLSALQLISKLPTVLLAILSWWIRLEWYWTHHFSIQTSQRFILAQLGVLLRLIWSERWSSDVNWRNKMKVFSVQLILKFYSSSIIEYLKWFWYLC